MLQTGQLIIQRGNLNNGNLNGQTGSLTSGGLSGPATYISVENDPVFRGSAAYTITQADIDRWNQDVEESAYFVSYSYLESRLTDVVNEVSGNAREYSDLNYYEACYYTDNAIASLGTTYVSKTELSAQGYMTSIPSEYITEQELSACGYLTYHQSLDGLVNEDELYTILSTYATKNYVDNAIMNAEIGGGDVTVDLTYYLRKDELDSVLISYVSKTELSAQSYITDSTVNSLLASYVSYSYLENKQYATTYDVSQMGYITTYDVSQMGYMTAQQVNDAIAAAQIIGADIDLSDYVKFDDLSACGYITANDVSQMGYITAADVPAAVDLTGYATEAYVLSKINEIDLSSYVTETELSECGYLTQRQDLSAYATKLYVEDSIGDIQTLVDIILGGSYSYSTYLFPELDNYVSKIELSACGYLTQHQDLSAYATKNYVDTARDNISVDISQIDLSSYVSKQELSACGYVTNAQLSVYATKAYVMDKVNSIEPVSYNINNTYNLSVWAGTLAQYNALSNHSSYQLYLIAEE